MKKVVKSKRTLSPVVPADAPMFMACQVPVMKGKAVYIMVARDDATMLKLYRKMSETMKLPKTRRKFLGGFLRGNLKNPTIGVVLMTMSNLRSSMGIATVTHELTHAAMWSLGGLRKHLNKHQVEEKLAYRQCRMLLLLMRALTDAGIPVGF